MVNRLRTLTGRACIWLTLAPLALGVPQALQGQANNAFPISQTHSGKERPLADRLPQKPSIPPTLTVPVEPLGFSAPGAIYLGQRNCLVSLDFLDENRLLFTFRVPGLMHRETSGEWTDERQIRAVVLELPAGTVAAEALWTVHDRVRYLWMLKDGHFLLRDKDGVQEGDANLNLKPLLHFPGPLLWMEMDPSKQYLVTNSEEPSQTASKPGDVDSPPTAQASMTVDGQKFGIPNLVVRILRIDTGQVILVSRARAAVHLPINSEGYIESLRGTGEQWILNLDYFTGGSKALAHVNSSCAPMASFISAREFLVTSCDRKGADQITALSTDGRFLWEEAGPSQAIWPLLVMAPDGSRLVRETLAVNHAINAYAAFDSADVEGQLVRVFDAVTGKVAMVAPATPPLDAGGNVAISPTGQRVALLNAGALEIFDLPAPPSFADSANVVAAH